MDYNYEKLYIDISKNIFDGIVEIEDRDTCYHIKCDCESIVRNGWIKNVGWIKEYPTHCIPFLKEPNGSETDYELKILNILKSFTFNEVKYVKIH